MASYRALKMAGGGKIASLLALAGVLGTCGGEWALAFTPADADAAFDAHAKAFYEERDGRAWFRESTDGGKASFWMRAEQLEMVLDACERTKKPEQLAMFTRLFHGFVADHGRTWADNPFNDDIMWMVIACVRGHLLTGDKEFLAVAKENFDLCYARAWSDDLGGGLWWKTENRSKNACVNGPAAIAAALLHRATGDEGYLAKARAIFLWEKATLFDEASGRVADSVSADGRLRRFALTYNQGTFVGAAHLLGFDDDAKKAALFTMDRLCRDGFLPPANETNDGGGFNGIGLRWIAKYVKDCREEETFGSWLRKNADAAWDARRASDNLSWCRWPQPTPEGGRHSWGCSSAVVALQVVSPAPAAQTASSAAQTAPAAEPATPVADGATLEVLGDGYAFTEGPAADAEGNVYFTDQPNDRIVKWNAADRTLTDWLKPAGRSNGLFFDKAGNLIACADGKNELWSIAPDRKETVLLQTLDGKLLNGPNDVWIRPDGNLYFTDPLYKRDYWQRDPASQLPGEFVYFFDVKSRKAVPVATDLKQPNGIIGTPDGKTVYVADIGAGKTYSYAVQKDGTLADKKLFCELGSDGMTLDAAGNVYLTGKGVTIFDSTGRKLANIPVPEPWTANVTFGGKDRQLLFITASRKVYGLRMKVKGAY